jgi:putative SOS response-associated peptidase YedK
MCGRFEQSETKRYYASALGSDTSDHLKWLGERTPSYNTGPGLCPWMIMLDKGELEFIGMRWGYRTPKEAAEKKKPVDLYAGGEVANRKLLPAHVPRRKGNYSLRWVV